MASTGLSSSPYPTPRRTRPPPKRNPRCFGGRVRARPRRSCRRAGRAAGAMPSECRDRLFPAVGTAGLFVDVAQRFVHARLSDNEQAAVRRVLQLGILFFAALGNVQPFDVAAWNHHPHNRAFGKRQHAAYHRFSFSSKCASSTDSPPASASTLSRMPIIPKTFSAVRLRHELPM